MDRRAKGLRTVGSCVILLNIVMFFLPMVKYDPANYPTERFSQLNYVMKVFSEEAPYESPYTAGRVIWMLLLIIVPVVISLVAGIWGIVGNERQIISSIMILASLALYIGLLASIGVFFPQKEYARDIAGYANMIVSIAAGVIALLTFFNKGEVVEESVIADIPQIKEMKQEKIQAKYNIIEADPPTPKVVEQQPIENNNEQKKITYPPYVPGPPKGVMVGIAGIYAGAEIPFNVGEKIRLGRLPNNDLVFEGQDKVSRNHCYIIWDGKSFMIKDSSSNGVFVNGSEDCLPQNIEIEIPIGSVIAIGDEKNTFRLE